MISFIIRLKKGIAIKKGLKIKNKYFQFILFLLSLLLLCGYYSKPDFQQFNDQMPFSNGRHAILHKSVDQAWISYYEGMGGTIETVSDMKLDSQGNILILLQSDGEVVTLKYNSEGDLLWEKRYRGDFKAVDEPISLAIDSMDKVIITCSSDSSITTIKYDTNGEQLWMNQYDEDGSLLNYDEPVDMAIDGMDDVLIAGTVCSQLDEEDMVCLNFDYIIIKYTSQGSLSWKSKYDYGKNDSSAALAIDTLNNIIVTGKSLNSSGPNAFDFATIKFNSEGVELWKARFDGPFPLTDIPSALAVDMNDDIFVTGKVFAGEKWYDIGTIKYNAYGKELWRKYFNGPADHNDEPVDIAIDELGNVFIVAQSSLMDNDGDLYLDYTSIKYDGTGKEQWIQYYDGLGNMDDQSPLDIIVDYIGNIYITGSSFGGYNQRDDFATLKYDTNGNIIWTTRFNGPRSYGDIGKRLAVDNENNVYVAGDVCMEVRAPDFEDFSCIDSDVALIKYKQNAISNDDDNDDDTNDGDDDDDVTPSGGDDNDGSGCGC